MDRELALSQSIKGECFVNQIVIKGSTYDGDLIVPKIEIRM